MQCNTGKEQKEILKQLKEITLRKVKKGKEIHDILEQMEKLKHSKIQKR